VLISTASLSGNYPSARPAQLCCVLASLFLLGIFPFFGGLLGVLDPGRVLGGMVGRAGKLFKKGRIRRLFYFRFAEFLFLLVNIYIYMYIYDFFFFWGGINWIKIDTFGLM
jgi:hypothetical protein